MLGPAEGMVEWTTLEHTTGEREGESVVASIEIPSSVITVETEVEMVGDRDKCWNMETVYKAYVMCGDVRVMERCYEQGTEGFNGMNVYDEDDAVLSIKNEFGTRLKGLLGE